VLAHAWRLEIDTVGEYNYEEAPRMGVSVDDGGLHGRIIKTTPADGCTSLNITHPRNAGDSAWFAKVDNGGCSLYTKVLNAQRAGAVACIVANDEPEPFRASLGHNANSEIIQIVAILVTQSTGQAIDQALNVSSEGLNAHIVPDALPWLVIFLPFIFIVFFTACTLVVVLWCRRRRRVASTERAPSKTLTPKQLLNIKTDQFSHAKHGDEEQECPICLDPFVEGDDIRLLPCGHIFHQKCVDVWLLEQAHTCPLCKADMRCDAAVV